jgi:hypothetical protein
MEILMMFSSWIEGVASGQVAVGTQALLTFVMVGDVYVSLYQLLRQHTKSCLACTFEPGAVKDRLAQKCLAGVLPVYDGYI